MTEQLSTAQHRGKLLANTGSPVWCSVTYRGGMEGEGDPRGSGRMYARRTDLHCCMAETNATLDSGVSTMDCGEFRDDILALVFS